MAEEKHTIEMEPCPEMQAKHMEAARLHIGLLGNYADSEESRFLLTPEACGLLTSAQMSVCMEEGAGVDINFSDEQYAEYGVTITDRATALKQDIVLSYDPLRANDIRQMKEGAALLCTMDSSLFDREVIDALLDCKITLCCLSNLVSYNNEPVFANIIEELDGRCAIMYAQDRLSYHGGGKGVLLGGVAGVNPCEVLLIGDGRNIHAAALAAMTRGAIVTLLNNDISALQYARSICSMSGNRLQTLAIHPRTLLKKVQTADVIIFGETTRPFEFPRNLLNAMKDSAYLLDLRKQHPSVAVPRTVAMAISNIMVNLLNDIALMEGIDHLIATTEGVQSGIVTYKGKLVDKLAASCLGMPSVDLSVMIAHTN